MKLTIDNLKEAGAFTSAPVEKTIHWKQSGEEFEATVLVKPLSYFSAVEDIIASRAGGDGLAARIASCIINDDGTPVFTPEDITGEADPERGPISHALAMELLSVIGEVSRLGKPQETSTPSESSGTNS